MGGYVTDELRTVFITGFPNDIKERELNNLLRFIPGYEASQMNWKNGQASRIGILNCCCDLQEQQHASPRPSHPHTHAAATHTTAALHFLSGTRVRPVLQWWCCTCCM
jgi:hypothetical protein